MVLIILIQQWTSSKVRINCNFHSWQQGSREISFWTRRLYLFFSLTMLWPNWDDSDEMTDHMIILTCLALHLRYPWLWFSSQASSLLWSGLWTALSVRLTYKGGLVKDQPRHEQQPIIWLLSFTMIYEATPPGFVRYLCQGRSSLALLMSCLDDHPRLSSVLSKVEKREHAFRRFHRGGEKAKSLCNVYCVYMRTRTMQKHTPYRYFSKPSVYGL